MRLTISVLILTLAFSLSALAAPRPADFNGDGYGDLAVGVPLEDIGGAVDAGGIQVLSGAAGGLLAGSLYIDQSSAGMPGIAAAGDRFGNSLAWGDFNNDGYTDLAVGSPGKNIGGAVAAGAWMAIYGSAIGLDPLGVINAQGWHQNSPNVPEDAEAGDRCGWVLTAGDFNGDGYDDIAVGCPGEGLQFGGEGVAITMYGSMFGLNAFAPVPSQLWHQDIGIIQDFAEMNDHFAMALTTGDFDADGFDDLAVGVPNEDLAFPDAGAGHVIYGTAFGLSDGGNQFAHQDFPGINGVAAMDDELGTSLAAGDFNGDGFDDLAVGVPFEDGPGAVVDGGAVNVIYGAAIGLAVAGNQYWHQSAGIAGDGAETNDNFGKAVGTGDFNNDGFDDLAVGTPGEDVGAVANAGAVNVLLGSAFNLVGGGSQFWHQGLTVDAAEAGDFYGSTLVSGDFNADGYADLAGGAPLDDSPGGVVDAGGATILDGAAAGLTAVGNQYREQDAGGNGSPAVGDGYGGGIYGP